MEKVHKNISKREKVIKEDPDAIKVRLNTLIDIGRWLLIITAVIGAVVFGCFIRLLML